MSAESDTVLSNRTREKKMSALVLHGSWAKVKIHIMASVLEGHGSEYEQIYGNYNILKFISIKLAAVFFYHT